MGQGDLCLSLGNRWGREVTRTGGSGRRPALTAEGAEVHVGLQPGDQGVDVGVVELQALQEGEHPVLPARPQQVQQVPLGDRTVWADKALGRLPREGQGTLCCRKPLQPHSAVRLKKGEAGVY